MNYLDGSHHNAKLSEHERKMIRCWIDSGAIYAGTNAAEGTGMIYSQIGRQTNRYKVGSYDWFSMGERWEPCLAAARKVVERRCNGCHQHSLPELDLTRDMQNVTRPKPGMRRVDQNYAVNLTHPELSLLVLGPLSKEAGGYEHCARKKNVPVFKDKNDPDYKVLMDYLDVLHDAQIRSEGLAWCWTLNHVENPSSHSQSLQTSASGRSRSDVCGLLRQGRDSPYE